MSSVLRKCFAAAAVVIPLFANPRPAPIALPLTFEPNAGQTDPQVKFLAHGQKSTLWLTEQGPVLAVGSGSKATLLRMRFEGGARAPEMVAENPQGGVSNYLTGSDPSKWQVNIQHFAKVRYREVYPGIDVVFYGNPQQIEYDFVVAPGADPRNIRVAFDGVSGLRVDSNGDLVLQTRQGAIRNRKPSIYQGDKPVQGHYVLRGKRKAGFVVDRYDTTETLVIDPVLTYATLLGGLGGDQAYAVAMDGNGMIYIGGETDSTNFPVKNALFPTGAQESPYTFPGGFVSEINPFASGGASLVYSTYIGGQNVSQVNALAADSAGNVVLVGATTSSPTQGFPIKNAFQPTFQNSTDCGNGAGVANVVCSVPFVTKIAPGGASLVYSSYAEGGNGDIVRAVTLDASGNAYIAGTSESTGITLESWNGVAPYQGELRQAVNGFLTVVGPSGSLLYSTYFGGGEDTGFLGIAVDSAGLVYISGSTTYTGLPVTAGAYQPKTEGSTNSFVVVFNLSPSANNILQYCTYFGTLPGAGGVGGADVVLSSIAADGKGNIYLAGFTDSIAFPTTNNAPYPTTTGNNFFGPFESAVVVKLNMAAQGNAQLLYSTYFGDGGSTYASGIAINSSGQVTMDGTTNSLYVSFLTTPDAFQCCYDGEYSPSSGQFSNLGFIARFDTTKSGASSVMYASYLGGNENSLLTSLAQDSAGKTLAVAGWIQYNAPVTPTAYQQNYSGQGTSSLDFDFGDAYVARFDLTTEGPVITSILNSGVLHAAAAGTTTSLSPGLLFTVEGTALGPTTPAELTLGSNGLVTTTLGGVQVLVNGVPAPLIYVSNTVINAVAPYEISTQVGNTIRVQVIYNGVAGALYPIQVAATAPGILNYDDGSGQAIVGNQDYSANGASNPAPINSVITIYATGEGQTTPPGVDGLPATNFNNLPKPNAAVTVTIGGIPATVNYAGAAPDEVAGLLQLSVTIPAGVTPGPSVPILLTIGGVKSQTTTTIAVSAQ